MFIKVTQSGNRRYAQLVESFRNLEGKPRQRTVCTLGRLAAGGEVDTLIASLQRAQGIELPAPDGHEPPVRARQQTRRVALAGNRCPASGRGRRA